MDDTETIKFLETGLSRQLTWIGRADSKTSFVFTANTAMLGLLAASAPRTMAEWTVAPAIFASFAAILGFASLLLVSFAAFPRTKGPRNSLIFFGGISQRDSGQFEAAACDMTAKAYISDLCAQCHRNAEIAERKFKWAQRALMSLYLAVVPWLLAIYLLYGGRK